MCKTVKNKRELDCNKIAYKTYVKAYMYPNTQLKYPPLQYIKKYIIHIIHTYWKSIKDHIMYCKLFDCKRH